MIKGCSPVDDKNLILDEKEKESFETLCAEIEPYIKKYIGADEFVNGKIRYCLYFPSTNKFAEETLPFLERQIPDLNKRIDNIKKKLNR